MEYRMPKLQTAILILLVLLPLTDLSAQGGSDSTDVSPGEKVHLEGRIKIKGSMPLIHIVLETDSSGDFVLTGTLAEELAENHRLKRVRIVGRLEDEVVGQRSVEVFRYRLLKED